MAKNKKSTTSKKKTINKKNMKIRLSIFSIFMLLFSFIFLFQAQIYALINDKGLEDFQNVINQEVVLHFINVGQGDAIALKLPNGKNMLIDAGPKSSADKLTNYLSNTFFKDNLEKTFDYFIITHPHEDHIGGSVSVFEEYQINSFYRPNVYTKQEAEQINLEKGANYITSNNISDTNVFKDAVNSSKSEPNSQINIFQASSLPVINEENFTFTFLTPNISSYSNLNNYSPMILLEVFNKKVIFTGDAEKEIESELMLKAGNLIKNIDILKVGHHGSSTSSTNDFISLTNPKFAAIQVGKNNSFNHPNTSTLEKFEQINSTILRNDIHGNFLIGFSQDTSISFFVSTNTGLPVAIEVWQVYLAGGIVAFYFVVLVDWKKFKFKK
jgi:competence protein ComEC